MIMETVINFISETNNSFRYISVSLSSRNCLYPLFANQEDEKYNISVLDNKLLPLVKICFNIS